VNAIVLLITGKKRLSESLNSDRERVCPVDSSWSEFIVYACMLHALCSIGAFREWGAPVLCLLVSCREPALAADETTMAHDGPC